jgi:hypothetical protein
MANCKIVVLMVFITVLITSCTRQELSDRQIQFNVALQDQDNRQVLLNAVRASKRYPMYFTQTGTISSSGIADQSSIGLTLPFGVHNGQYSVAPNLKLQEGLLIASNGLDTQEFFQGFLAPAKLSLVNYYLSYGWPQDLILYSFIREIDLTGEQVDEIKADVGKQCGKGVALLDCVNLPNKQLLGDHDSDNPLQCERAAVDVFERSSETRPSTAGVTRIINSPSDPCRFLEFQYIVALLDKLNIHTHEVVSKSTHDDGNTTTFTVGSVPVKMNSSSKETEYNLKIDDELNCAVSTTAATDTLHVAPSETTASPGCDSNGLPRVIVRSPEAIIFYMGELITAEEGRKASNGWGGRQQFTPMVNISSSDVPDIQPLFIVRSGNPGAESAAVQVMLDEHLNDNNYYIPRSDGEAGQSMHLVSLVEQLLALQKKGSQLPTIPTVQVIGQ